MAEATSNRIAVGEEVLGELFDRAGADAALEARIDGAGWQVPALGAAAWFTAQGAMPCTAGTDAQEPMVDTICHAITGAQRPSRLAGTGERQGGGLPSKCLVEGPILFLSKVLNDGTQRRG